MVRTIIIAGATLAALTVPSLATEWNVLKDTKSHEGTMTSLCFVVDRPAAAGEQLIAGPFATQALGQAALGNQIVCNVKDEEGGLKLDRK